MASKLVVSIHAPRFREAMPAACNCSVLMVTFQSTPPVSGRRCAIDYVENLASPCFNPRPPFPGGDAATVEFDAIDEIVSIHAPRFREAMLISRNYRKHQNKKPALREPLYS